MPASRSATLVNDEDRPRLSLSSGVGADVRRPKNILGDHGAFSHFGDTERADRFFRRTDGEVFKRDGAGAGVGGGGRGVMNLSAGFIVLISPLAIELIEALR